MGGPIHEEVQKAVDLLHRLTTPEESVLTEGAKVRMPPYMVKASQGVAFLWQTKAGVGIGLEFGKGFVINRLGDGKWSAPSFFTMKDISAGFVLTVKKSETLFCVKDVESLGKFTSTEFNLGTDLMLYGRMDPYGRDVPGKAETKTHATWGPSEGAKVAPFTIVEGAGADASISGGCIMRDSDQNERMYGNVSVEDIINGTVSPPAEFQPLYDALNAMDAQA